MAELRRLSYLLYTIVPRTPIRHLQCSTILAMQEIKKSEIEDYVGKSVRVEHSMGGAPGVVTGTLEHWDAEANMAFIRVKANLPLYPIVPNVVTAT